MAGNHILKNKSQYLDLATKLVPKLKGPRKLVKDIFGFRARQVAPGGSKNAKRKAARYGKGGNRKVLVGGNGGLVHTVNAPVAFARSNTAKPGFYIREVDADTIIVHSVDSVGQVIASATANAYSVASRQVNPTDTTLFSYLNPLLDMYTKYKLSFLKIHYVHFCPTSSPGEVLLSWCPDPNSTDPASPTQQLNTNACVSGAAYEDFAYECNSREFDSDWKYISDITDADEDDRLICEGSIYVGSANANSSAPLGRYLVESEWILTGRRDPVLSPFFGLMKRVLRSKGADTEKQAALQAICSQMLKTAQTMRKKIRHQPTVYECIQDAAQRFKGTEIVDTKLLAPSIQCGAVIANK